MKSENKIFFSQSFLARFVFLFFIFAAALFSCPLFAEETAKVSDVVNVYVYHSEHPETVHPLYIGDTIPADGIIYLPDAKSTISFTLQGQNVQNIVLKNPGFYNASGVPVTVTDEARSVVARAAQTQTKLEAENLVKDSESNLTPFQIDDPQKVASPTT